MLISSFLTTFFLIFLLFNIAKKLNLYDIPNDRKLHYKPIPKIGGIAFFICFFLMSYRQGYINYYLLTSSSLLLLLVFLDDFFELNRYFRLISQILISIPLLFQYQFFTTSLINELVLISFLIFIYVSFINLFNFFDGLNTILSSQFILIMLSYSINQNILGDVQSTQDLSIIVGSVASFLVINSLGIIFMGDFGSCFLGIISANFLLDTLLNNEINYLFLTIVPLIPLLCDTSLTILIRLKNKEKFFSTPHNQHAYQLLARSGFKHYQVSIFYGFKLFIYTLSANLIFKQFTNYIYPQIIFIFLILFIDTLSIMQIRKMAFRKKLIS